MELLIIAIAVILIGILTVEANEVGVDSRDLSAGPFGPEPTGLA